MWKNPNKKVKVKMACISVMIVGLAVPWSESQKLAMSGLTIILLQIAGPAGSGAWHK